MAATQVAKNRISIEKIKRYKDLKAQQKLIEAELEELKQYFESRLNKLGLDDIVVDCYRVKRTCFSRDYIYTDKLRDEQPQIFMKYSYNSDVERLSVS